MKYIDLPVKDAPDAEVTLLERGIVRDCGVAGLMCQSLCYSVALTQSPNAAPLLRRLTCAGLLSKYSELNLLRSTREGYRQFSAEQTASADKLFFQIVSDEIDILKRYGNDASYLGIHALSAALGIRAAYGQRKPNAVTGDMQTMWEAFEPANPTSQRVIRLWNPGGHWQLCMEPGWTPVWSHMERADMLGEIMLRIQLEEEAALNSPILQVAALAKELVNWWKSDVNNPQKRPLIMAFRKAEGGKFKTVAEAALSALSIPLSNAAAERSFSILTNLEVKTRLHGGERYVSNCLKLRFNRIYVAQSNAYRLSGIDQMFSEACRAFFSAEEQEIIDS